MKAKAYTRKQIRASGIFAQVGSVIAFLWELIMLLGDKVTTLRLVAIACSVYLFILGAKYKKMARESKNDTIYLKNWNKAQQMRGWGLCQ